MWRCFAGRRGAPAACGPPTGPSGASSPPARHAPLGGGLRARSVRVRRGAQGAERHARPTRCSGSGCIRRASRSRSSCSGSAGSWGLPLIAGVLAGDVFSSEDRHGTWKTVLTRSCTRAAPVRRQGAGRRHLRAGAAPAAGRLERGRRWAADRPPSAGRPRRDDALARAVSRAGGGRWLLSALPLLAFASIAVLFSVATRNGIVGVLGPALVALVMQLLALVGTGVWVHVLLVASAFDALARAVRPPPVLRPAGDRLLVSLVWIVACLGGAWLLLRRRDFAGTPVGAPAGWAAPVRVAIGPRGGHRAARARRQLGPGGRHLGAPEGEHHADVQQPHAAPAARARPHRPARRAAQRAHRLQPARQHPVGPGRLELHADVFIPQPGAVPFQQTPVTYDLTLQSNGCYKASRRRRSSASRPCATGTESRWSTRCS